MGKVNGDGVDANRHAFIKDQLTIFTFCMLKKFSGNAWIFLRVQGRILHFFSRAHRETPDFPIGLSATAAIALYTYNRWGFGCRHIPMHFTRKTRGIIFVENFLENIFWHTIFFLKMHFYLKKHEKLIFGRFEPISPKNNFPGWRCWGVGIFG